MWNLIFFTPTFENPSPLQTVGLSKPALAVSSLVLVSWSLYHATHWYLHFSLRHLCRLLIKLMFHGVLKSLLVSQNDAFFKTHSYFFLLCRATLLMRSSTWGLVFQNPLLLCWSGSTVLLSSMQVLSSGCPCILKVGSPHILACHVSASARALI